MMTNDFTVPTVALATCRELPQLARDTRSLIAPLGARGITVIPAVWDDPDVGWERFDVVVVRSCWDYAGRRQEFLEWARGSRLWPIRHPCSRGTQTSAT